MRMRFGGVPCSDDRWTRWLVFAGNSQSARFRRRRRRWSGPSPAADTSVTRATGRSKIMTSSTASMSMRFTFCVFIEAVSISGTPSTCEGDVGRGRRLRSAEPVWRPWFIRATCRRKLHRPPRLRSTLRHTACVPRARTSSIGHGGCASCLPMSTRRRPSCVFSALPRGSKFCGARRRCGAPRGGEFMNGMRRGSPTERGAR